MHGHIYSGNLNALKDIIERLRNEHDMVISSHAERYDDYARNCITVCEVMVVKTQSGTLIDQRAFEFRDADVKCNMQTEWLRRVHSQLQHWK